MTVQYIYHRFHTRYERTVSSLSVVLAGARHDVEYNEAYPECIICEDGTVLDHEAIMEQSGLRDSDPEEE